MPIRETTTGCEDLLSESGGMMFIASTDPRLVPTHKEGTKAKGSEMKFHILTKSNFSLQFWTELYL